MDFTKQNVILKIQDHNSSQDRKHIMDIASKEGRQAYIQEIQGNENKNRREEHFKRMEVYNERQAQWVIDKLLEEFSTKTVAEMRKVFSINLTRRIVDELASIYKKAPSRYWSDLGSDQEILLEETYLKFGVNKTMKRANKLFKLHRQVAIQVVPKQGELQARVLAPHQYDVIPDPEMPEKALAYIISSMDRRDFLQDFNSPSEQQNIGDGINQKIADVDDFESNMRYIWWTKEFNFSTDSKGNIIGEVLENPIGELPFIDIAEERDFEYWVRAGSDIVEFCLDFLKLLSDHFNIIRLQGYSQAVVAGEKCPENLVIGPNHVLFLKLDRDSPVQSSFQFVTPSPDLSSSITSLEMFLNLFLSSKGIDQGTIKTKEGGSSFSSGIERLLAMLQRFEASSDDIEQFRYAEYRYYELFKKWQLASSNNDLLSEEFKVRGIPDSSEVSVQFEEPEMIQTQTEREDSQIKLLEAGLTTKKAAIAMIHGINDTAAEEMLEQIEKEELPPQPIPLPLPPMQVETPDDDSEEDTI